MKQFFEQRRRGNLHLSAVGTSRFAARVPIQRRTVYVRNLRDVPAAFSATFQFQRPYPQVRQASHVPQQAQVLRGPKTAERFALADLPQGFAQALLLLHHQGQAAVLETARLRTPPLVGGAVVHPRRQQAMPGQGQTHGSVHEYFEVHTGKRFRQCSDLFEAQFPGQIDPLHPGLTPERHSGAVYGMGLCGQMQRH